MDANKSVGSYFAPTQIRWWGCYKIILPLFSTRYNDKIAGYASRLINRRAVSIKPDISTLFTHSEGSINNSNETWADALPVCYYSRVKKQIFVIFFLPRTRVSGPITGRSYLV